MPLKTTRRPITDEGAERLAEAIMLRAVDDWFNAHRWIGKLIKKRNAALGALFARHDYRRRSVPSNPAQKASGGRRRMRNTGGGNA